MFDVAINAEFVQTGAASLHSPALLQLNAIIYIWHYTYVVYIALTSYEMCTIGVGFLFSTCSK